MECARSRETVKRSALADLADYGYCAAHSRFFWGVRLHALCAPDGTPRAFTLADPRRDEREVGLELLARCRRHGGELLVCDKGYAGREFAAAVAEMGATVVRPKRKDERGRGPHLAPIRQRIESIFWSLQGHCSPWSATGRAPWPGCANASSRAGFASRPASASTTGWGVPAGPLPTTAPEAAGVESII